MKEINGNTKKHILKLMDEIKKINGISFTKKVNVSVKS